MTEDIDMIKDIDMTDHNGVPEYDRDEYKPGRVANYMLAKAKRDRISVSPMKLQRLVYTGYGWVRAILDKRLFDEGIEAWAHGPIIPSLYHEFKKFGWAPINKNERCIQFHPFADEHYGPEPATPITDKEVCHVLDIVWKIYKDFTAPDLSDQTDIVGTPWHTARHANAGGVLDDDEIKDYFDKKLRGYIRKYS